MITNLVMCGVYVILCAMYGEAKIFCGVAILRSNKNALSRNSSGKNAVTVFRRIFLRSCVVDIYFFAMLRCSRPPQIKCSLSSFELQNPEKIREVFFVVE